MHQMNVSVIGVAVTEVRKVVTESGYPMARFRLVCRPRKFDSTTGTMTEFDPSFVTVQCWRQLAENVSASVRKGDPVVVTGRLRVREWEQEGRSRISVEIDAQSVGHDLNRGATWLLRPGSTRERGADPVPRSTSAAAGRSSPVTAGTDATPAAGGERRDVA